MKPKRTIIKTPYRYFDAGLDDWIEGEEKDDILNDFAIYIGWIIIEFNSLESQIDYHIKEQLSHSETKDEMVYLFLSKMSVSEKIDLLIKLYGMWVFRDFELIQFREKLNEIESKLREANTKRNRYAHTDWSDMFKERYFKVKTQPKKDGVQHTFMKFEQEHMEEDLELIQNLHGELYEFDEEFNQYRHRHSERILVFSYGSNMFNKRLKGRVPSTQILGIGKLIGYKLECTKVSKDGSGKATVIKTDSKTDEVWGTLSIIEKSEKHLLDKSEGLNNGYNEIHDSVKTMSEEEVVPTFYIADDKSKNKSLKPYCWYKKFIVEGAIMNKLPLEYINLLKELECIEDKKHERVKKELKLFEEEKTDNK